MPLVFMVSASVARATDGAAPNRAAKLLGLKIVPRIEKPETKKPPTKKRIRINFNRCSSLAFLSEVYEHRIKNQVQTVSGIWSVHQVFSGYQRGNIHRIIFAAKWKRETKGAKLD